MKFWKLQGIGNDFIAIDGRNDSIESDNYGELAKKVCHRKFSVGADGLLVVKNSNVADVEMVYYNSDGSRASMCGNGLRCFVKFVYDNNIIKKEEFNVYTLDGIKKIKINIKDNKIDTITVNMGRGSFKSDDIPVNTKKEVFINENIQILDKKFTISSMLMGVPHTVVFVDNINMEDIHKYGPLIEKYEIFVKNTNVNFVKVIDESNILVRTWERGCGYTLGCGTGMTASVIISNYLNKVCKNVNVISEGGSIKIDLVDEETYMSGRAEKICEGILEV
ncbi:diaminopimelate epimerase [Terrisporobacter mayombei]|uniref:Diaminopimelate epimerase n=1 Tax=Terrisporobacter mayombei TaxID=1541 RepID=A0ABY9Q1T4_9FIRM|nr:diaminopimelate epimerase [Terrisporobacter mayombei]MCC3867322.1 diaminopimelate epimerase [Terrisporobacter mayombei]WMT81584.1 Diaminopimelate epimerase [Terrisporobacter mayombei]